MKHFLTEQGGRVQGLSLIYELIANSVQTNVLSQTDDSEPARRPTRFPGFSYFRGPHWTGERDRYLVVNSSKVNCAKVEMGPLMETTKCG